MTDESDSESSHIMIHKHTWRSQSKLVVVLSLYTYLPPIELNEWFGELDSRYQSKLTRNNASTPSKERRNGSTSKSLPPPGAPKWAIDPLWKNGIKVIIVLYHNTTNFVPGSSSSNSEASRDRLQGNVCVSRCVPLSVCACVSVLSVCDSV